MSKNVVTPLKRVRQRRLAFVIPRFERGIAGGAETLAAQIAEHLAARGDYIEILTTCARDNRTWNNEFPEGDEQIGDLTVRRFKVDSRDLEKWIPYQLRLHDGMQLSLEEQLEWLEHSVNSSALYEYIKSHSSQFDLLFFAPYLFGTTFWGSLINPSKSVLIPCLHDESYAYTEAIASMFRQVRGAVFNAAAEGELARRLYGEISGGEVGMGFEIPLQASLCDVGPYFSDNFPYVLYFGRKETGKNVHKLIDDFIVSKEVGILNHTVKLVIAGGGSYTDLGRADALTRGDVIDVGYLSEFEKSQIVKHCTVLCQPSVNESFGIVLMEAWMYGAPALVNCDCAVTREHITNSGGGLYYRGAMEFGACVAKILEDTTLREQMAEAGSEYIKTKYTWPAVLQRFDQVIEEFI